MQRKRLKGNMTCKGGASKVMVIPYHSKLTKCLTNRLKTNGVGVMYQNKGSLKSLIGRVKQKKSDDEKSGNYNIKCAPCIIFILFFYFLMAKFP